MEEVIPNLLYRTEAENSSFGKGLKSRAYLLVRPEGNVVMYNSSQLNSQSINNLGGVHYQYLTSKNDVQTSSSLGVQVFCPLAEKATIEKTITIERGYSGDFNFDPTLTVLQTPGASPAASCFIWVTETMNILFTGTTLFLDKEGKWAVNVEKKNVSRMIESLEKLKEYEIDVIVPSVSGNDEKTFQSKDSLEGLALYEDTFYSFDEVVDTVLNRLRSGSTK